MNLCAFILSYIHVQTHLHVYCTVQATRYNKNMLTMYKHTRMKLCALMNFFYIHVCEHTYMGVNTFSCAQMHAHTHIHPHTTNVRAHTHVHTHTKKHAHTPTHTHIHTHTQTHTHTHTHTHTYLLLLLTLSRTYTHPHTQQHTYKKTQTHRHRYTYTSHKYVRACRYEYLNKKNTKNTFCSSMSRHTYAHAD